MTQQPKTNRDNRMRLAAGLGMLVLAGGVATALFVLSHPPQQTRPAIEAQDLTKALAAGAIEGPDALALAKRLEQQAFATLPPASSAGPPEQPVSVHAMRQSASAAFIEAAGVLAQDQDAAVRQALAAAANPAARSQGLDQLWGLAQTESPTAPALLRASSALMAAFEDPRAAEALERASAHNPQDIHMWRLSSFMFSKAGETGQAEGAAIVAGALDRAAQGDRANAAADFARALPLIERPAARGYVLGQLGDYAVETDDLRAALNHYKEAVAVLAKAGAAGALSLEASKLARVHIALGDPAAACAALRKARASGASLTPQEQTAACGSAR